jgi:sec-independent protein translocase protein TatB
MFDIGFAELLLIGVVGLIVVGPEQLPGAVRTTLAWINRFRRSFDQIRTEVRRELHNDEVMQKLKSETQELQQQVRDTTRSFEREIQAISEDPSAMTSGNAADDTSSTASDELPQKATAGDAGTSDTAPKSA